MSPIKHDAEYECIPRSMYTDPRWSVWQGYAEKYHCLINTTKCINSLEAKDRLSGYIWRPSDLTGTHKCRGGHKIIENIIIKDFDGDKEVARTTYLTKTPRKTEYGIYQSMIASRYHGKNSYKWKRAELSLTEIIETLDSGYAVAPGHYCEVDTYKESQRSVTARIDQSFILFDGDEWTAEHPSVPIGDLLTRYPTLSEDFYWIGESISSCSALKPEWRYRLMLVLPEPVSDPFIWESIIDFVVERYPFIARGVGVDKVRLSYGNARKGHLSKVLGGMFSEMDNVKRAALNVKRESEEKERRKADIKKQRDAKRSGDLSPNHPWTVFTNVTAPELLQQHNLATPLTGDAWHWHESGQGNSFQLLSDSVIHPYSESMNAINPAGPTNPVNAHRFIAYALWGLDVSDDDKKEELYKAMAAEGYGQWKEQRRYRPAPVLHVDKERAVVDTWVDNQVEIKKAFEDEARITLLRADTGSGKDYVKLSYIIEGDGNFIESVPTTDLAEEKESLFNYRIEDNTETMQTVYRWRSPMANWGDNEKRHWHERVSDPFPADSKSLCIQAPLFEKAREKGIIPQRSLCRNCPAYFACREGGYLSQIRKASKASYVLSAQRDLFFNPALSGFTSKLLESKRNPVGIIDEAKVHELFLSIVMHKETLQDKMKMWRGTLTGSFCERLLTALEVECDMESVRDYVQSLTEAQVKEISIGLSNVRFRCFAEPCDIPGADYKVWLDNNNRQYAVANSAADLDNLLKDDISAILPVLLDIETSTIVLNLDQAISLNLYRLDEVHIDEIPSVQAKDWTLVDQLRVLFLDYDRVADAPLRYKDGILSFDLPPQIHPKVGRLTLMSATLETETIKDKVFPDVNVSIVDTPPAKWEDGVEVYQIRTGRYPRQSVYDYTDKSPSLKGFGLKAMDMFLREVKRDQNTRHALITHKLAIDNVQDELDALDNVVVTNYGAAEGENEKYEDCEVFWIMFAQILPDYEVFRRAKMIYGRDLEPLNYERAETGFADPRIQQVSDAATQSELIQAIGRARLVRRRGVKVVVMTGVYLDGITDRHETMLFDYADYKDAGSLANLANLIQAREELEAQVKELKAQGCSVRAAADILGVGWRKANKLMTA